jgi:hypothetical protein
VETAQEGFKSLMRDAVAPRLRGLGLKGSGQNYTLPSQTHWAFLGFQKSAYSDRERIDFTVNVTVVSRSDWERGRQVRPQMPAKPGANWDLPPYIAADFGDYWNARLGHLMPGGRDRWWTFNPNDTTDDLARAIVAEIEEFALPAILERITSSHFANPS